MVLCSDLWVKESGNVEGREKLVYRCMPLFLLYFFLSYVFTLTYHLVFLFSFVRFLFFSSLHVFSSFLRMCLLLLFMATSLPFILLEFMGFLPFVPKVVPTIFDFLWTSLQDCPLNYWLPGHYLCSKCACHTTLHFQTKLTVLFPSPSLLTSPQMDKG